MSRNLIRCLALTFFLCSWAMGQGQQSSDSSKNPDSSKTPENSKTQPGKSEPLSVTPISTSLPPPGDNPGAQAAPVVPKMSAAEIAEIEKRPRISKETRMKIIQAINAEFARTRRTLPLGYKDITLTAEGKLKPEDSRLYQIALAQGSAAKVGDRIQITSIIIRDKSIYLEINGGPKKKTKWYQHIQFGGMGGMATPGGDPAAAQPVGAAISLEFKDHVPEITGPELKLLLDPLFDFSVKTATDVYLETVPPKVKAAIKAHEVLVGMNHDMVVMAKDRPPQKLREKDEKGVEYEEWIYGQPPHDVTFVRFVGDEVTQVKIMKVSGEEVLKTEKEVDVRDGVVTLAAATASTGAGAQDQQKSQSSTPPPTLKRPGESNDTNVNQPPTGPRPRGRYDPGDPSTAPPMPQPGQTPPNL